MENITENNKKNPVPYIAVTSLSAYMSVYLCKSIFAAIKPELTRLNLFTKTDLGNISSSFFYAYAIGQLINGFLGDILDSKLIATLGLLFGGTVTVLFPVVATTTDNAIFLWAVCGFVCSMLYGPLSKIIVENTETKTARNLTRLLGTFSVIGQMLTYGVIALCIEFLSWQASFYILGAVVIAVSVLFYLIITKLQRENIIKITKRKKQQEESSNFTWKEMLNILLPGGLIPSLICMMINGMLRTGISDWAPTYIAEQFNINSQTAVFISIALPAINFIGTLISLKMLKLTKDDEHLLSAILYSVSAGLFCFMFFFGDFNVALTIIALFIACALGICINVCYYSVYILRFKKFGKTSGLCGFFDCIEYLGAAISTVVIGTLSEQKGWNFTISTWIIIAAAGAVCCIICSIMQRRASSK